MAWQDLVKKPSVFVAPWIGTQRLLNAVGQSWKIEGSLPESLGWYSFFAEGRKARVIRPAEPDRTFFRNRSEGYLVGDRFVSVQATADMLSPIVEPQGARIYLIPPGLERFTRVIVGELGLLGPQIYIEPSMTSDAGQKVAEAYEERLSNLLGIKGVTPALEAAWHLECHLRDQAELARIEIRRRRVLEEERERLAHAIGTSEGRRALAAIDFAEAAKAALALRGATYLDHRIYRPGELAVRFRLTLGSDPRRFECICQARTLQIIEAGICLVDSATGRRGDSLFTLETLPAVIQQAWSTHVLVVTRHA